MTSITLETTLETIDCIHCGMIFAVPRDWHRERRNNHKNFWCPGCRGQMYYPGKSDKERLRAQLAHQKEISEVRARQIREKEYQVRAAKGQLTKFRKRAGKGACPCCNRHFQNLARHMQSQHPEFVGDDT